MKPSAFELFCAYYLGLDKDFRYRFFNLHKLAQVYGVSPSEMMMWLKEYYLDPETLRHVNFNIAAVHRDAQTLSESNQFEEVKTLAKRAFFEYFSALQKYDEKKDFENVDYEKILGDLTPSEEKKETP